MLVITPQLQIEDKRPAFIVWQLYQRRAETLGPKLRCEAIRYFPNRFTSKLLRPLDYLLKSIQTLIYLAWEKPLFVVLQAPPLFAAIPTIITGTRYVVDVHNGMVQSFWGKLPFTGAGMRRAMVLITHNAEIEAMMRDRYPTNIIINIADPIEVIRSSTAVRDSSHILFVCSFDRDEPVELIPDIVRALPEFRFTITADVTKLKPTLRSALEKCGNLSLTGFLSKEAYHSLLCSSKAAIVLSNMPSVQPSGAVEALSSDTPLIVSKTSLTESLFGDWAVLVDNDAQSIVSAARLLKDDALDLSVHRDRWNEGVSLGISNLSTCLSEILPRR